MARRRLVTRLSIAKLTGRTKQAITEAANRGSLREACVGRKIDLDHPKAVAYARRCGAKIPAPAPPKAKPRKAAAKGARGRPKSKSPRKKAPRKPPAPSPKLDETPVPDEPALPIPVGLEGVDADRFADMTLRQITQEVGTWPEFEAIVAAVAKLASIREKDDRHMQFKGSVIPRDFVSAHMMNALERLFRRLLGPTPKTIIRDAAQKFKAGEPIEDIEKKAIETIGAELKSCRATISRAIRKA